MILKIVQCGPDAPAETKRVFEHIIPGSIVVMITRYHDHLIREADGCFIYYEGGIYSRPATRKPTAEERKEYALIAAGRAKERYPTVARACISQKGLVSIGWVDTDTWAVELGD